MKCGKCQAEWRPGNIKSQLVTCPFCGASLCSATAMDDNQTMQSVMVRIVEQFGEEILSQERKCLAAFKDFAPKLEKEQKILKIAFGEGISDYFLRCPVADRESHFQKARQLMSVRLPDEASLLVVNSFAIALGWNVSRVQREQDIQVGNVRQVSRMETTMHIEDTDTSPKVASEDEANKMYQAGEACYAKKNNTETMKRYRKAADAGNTSAIDALILGDRYRYGWGVERDYGEAMKWYRKVADAGNTQAMVRVGALYEDGNGVVKDRNEAMKWYRQAADAGDDQAMEKIGDLYKRGRGVEKRDYGEAMKWYRKAADAGNAQAMEDIGNLYYYGQGVEQDDGEAVKWYQKAANAGHVSDNPIAKHMLKKKRDSLCYITTAVCTNLNKPDDCYELMMFRKFRDNWLMKQPDGETLIREYYALAPTIVQRIDSLANKNEIYQGILTKYLNPCLHMIEQKDMEGCKKMYMKMVFEVGKIM